MSTVNFRSPVWTCGQCNGTLPPAGGTVATYSGAKHHICPVLLETSAEGGTVVVKLTATESFVRPFVRLWELSIDDYWLLSCSTPRYIELRVSRKQMIK